MSAPDAVERVRMALAEMGYVDPYMRPALAGSTQVVFLDADEVPREAGWRAFVVAGLEIACWSCWSTRDPGSEPGCPHDPWTEPWPPVVRP